MLNIINNAFRACAQKDLPGLSLTVTVATKNLGDRIEISVQDNGPGIPDAIKDKIFQPFFTTKPTGQGTGLGLSLAYDIVKAHRGEIKVESLPDRNEEKEVAQEGKEGIGSSFVIELPMA